MQSTLEVADLSFAYRKDGPNLFSGLSYSFPDSTVTALTGPSGCGKSTLLYLLGLLLTPKSGQIRFQGQPVSTWPDQDRSRLRATRLGFVFQDSQLDPTRKVSACVSEPGLYSGGKSTQWRTRAAHLLAEFGLEHLGDSYPTEISRGQAQRVAICRAMLVSPAVILADEPTGNLDRANAELVLSALSDAARLGTTVVIATHDPYVLEHAQGVMEL